HPAGEDADRVRFHAKEIGAPRAGAEDHGHGLAVDPGQLIGAGSRVGPGPVVAARGERDREHEEEDPGGSPGPPRERTSQQGTSHMDLREGVMSTQDQHAGSGHASRTGRGRTARGQGGPETRTRPPRRRTLYQRPLSTLQLGFRRRASRGPATYVQHAHSSTRSPTRRNKPSAMPSYASIAGSRSAGQRHTSPSIRPLPARTAAGKASSML